MLVYENFPLLVFNSPMEAQTKLPFGFARLVHVHEYLEARFEG